MVVMLSTVSEQLNLSDLPRSVTWRRRMTILRGILAESNRSGSIVSVIEGETGKCEVCNHRRKVIAIVISD